MASTEQEKEADLKALQDQIYRDKVRRARAMTREERFQECFDLTTEVFERMHAGAMHQKKLRDPEEGWREVDRRLARLRSVHERGLYVSEKPGKILIAK